MTSQMPEFDANQNGEVDFCNECIADDRREDHSGDCDCYCHYKARIKALEAERNELKRELEKFKAPHYAVVKLEAELQIQKAKSEKYENRLHQIHGGHCQGNRDDHGECEDWMRKVAEQVLLEQDKDAFNLPAKSALGAEGGELKYPQDESIYRGGVRIMAMLNLNQVRELRKAHGHANHRYQVDKQHDQWVALNDLLDTLENALKVVEAAKECEKQGNVAFPKESAWGRLCSALTPFTAKTGDA